MLRSSIFKDITGKLLQSFEIGRVHLRFIGGFSEIEHKALMG